MICNMTTSKFNDLCGKSFMKRCWSMGFENPISRDSWLITHKPIGMLLELFMVQGTLLLRWLIRSTPIYSIGIIHLINTPSNWSNLSCKMNTRLFATNTRMPNPLGMLAFIMFSFIPGGFHLGLLLRQVSMSLAIGLAFGIFVLYNGEVSWSMWILLLWTSYDFPSFLCIQDCKTSIFTELPFVVYLLLCCNISNFFYDSFPLICRSLTMKSGYTCPFAI